MEENTITINKATKWAIQGFLGGVIFGFIMANKAEESQCDYLKQQDHLYNFDSDDDDENDDNDFFNNGFNDNKDHSMKCPFKPMSTSTFIIPTTITSPPFNTTIYNNKMLRKPIIFINTKIWISLPFYQNAVLYDFKEFTTQSDKALSILRKNYSIFDISIQFMNKNKLLVLVRYRNQEAQQEALQNGLSLHRSTISSSSASNDHYQQQKKKNISILYPTQILNNHHHHTILIIKQLPLDDFQETELKIRQSLLHPMVRTLNHHQEGDGDNENNSNDDDGNRLEILNIYKNYFPYGYYQGDVTVIIRGRVINKGPKTRIYLERYGNMYECQFIPVPVTLALV